MWRSFESAKRAGGTLSRLPRTGTSGASADLEPSVIRWRSVSQPNWIGHTTSSAYVELTDAVKELTTEVRALREEISASRTPTVVYKDISLEEAIEEIAILLKTEAELYPSDISERLQIDYFTVVDALNALQQKGKVEYK